MSFEPYSEEEMAQLRDHPMPWNEHRWLATVAARDAEIARLREGMGRARLVVTMEQDVLRLGGMQHQVESLDSALRWIDQALNAAPITAPKSTRCTCAAIQASDATRHFRECPLRAEYPKPPEAP